MSIALAVPHITLSPAYRLAQRAVAQWLELRDDARHERVALRAAWSALNAVEHARLVRWLAWLQVTASMRGDQRLAARIQRLDTTLDLAITRAARTLPGQRQAAPDRRLRLSA